MPTASAINGYACMLGCLGLVFLVGCKSAPAAPTVVVYTTPAAPSASAAVPPPATTSSLITWGGTSTTSTTVHHHAAEIPEPPVVFSSAGYEVSKQCAWTDKDNGFTVSAPSGGRDALNANATANAWRGQQTVSHAIAQKEATKPTIRTVTRTVTVPVVVERPVPVYRYPYRYSYPYRYYHPWW